MLNKLRELGNTLRYLVAHPVNERRRLSGVLRYARWQLGSRLVPGPVAVQMIDGVRILAAPGTPGATGAVYFGLHEFNDMALTLQFLRQDDLFVDAGANVGSYTLLAASTGARCMSFEPLPATYQKLVANIGLNGWQSRVEAMNAGLGAVGGEIRFTVDEDTANHVAYPNDQGRTTLVPVVTLDETLAGQHPTLIKIDVEGYEIEVIRGARKILAEQGPLALIVEINDASHHYGSSEAEFLELMEDLGGYRPYDYDPVERRLAPLTGVSQRSNNTIFTSDPAAVSDRVQSAPRRTVFGKSF